MQPSLFCSVSRVFLGSCEDFFFWIYEFHMKAMSSHLKTARNFMNFFGTF
jgi:hypothetical protein